MNLAQLRAFHVVARERGFTRAAAATGMSQPTLSNHVAALEAAYAVRLFERRAREIRPTELGRMLFDVTTRLFDIEEEARALLSGTKTLQRGHLRVAADNAYHAVPVLAELRRAHPGLTFRLAIGNSAVVLQQLVDGDVDVAVTAKVAPDPRLDAVEMRQDRLILFVPRHHPWAGLRRVRLSKLAGADVVLRERGSFTREVFEQAIAAAGIRLGTVMEVQTREGVRETVAAGFGVGVVFASEHRAEPRFRSLQFADASLSVGEYAVCLAARRHVALIAAFMAAAARNR